MNKITITAPDTICVGGTARTAEERDFEEALKTTFRQPATRIDVAKTEDPYASFFFMLSDYPVLLEFWDIDEKVCDEARLLAALPSLSHGEAIMAKFFMTVWFGDKREFDIAEAASVLDLSHRSLITKWMLDPFWP